MLARAAVAGATGIGFKLEDVSFSIPIARRGAVSSSTPAMSLRLNSVPAMAAGLVSVFRLPSLAVEAGRQRD